MAHWTRETFVENADHYVEDLEAVADGAADVRAVLDLVSLDPEEGSARPSVLDLGCGIGRHLVAFADAGATATGVDLSPPFVDRARDRAAAEGVADAVTVREGDMRDLDAVDGVGEDYDLVTLFYNTFGYFDDETCRSVLREVRERLAPDGALVLQVLNKEGYLANFDADTVHVRDERRWVDVREYDPENSRLETTHRVYDPETEEFLASFSSDLRLYAPVELRSELERCGFEATVFETLDGDALERESTTLVAVGRPA